MDLTSTLSKLGFFKKTIKNSKDTQQLLMSDCRGGTGLKTVFVPICGNLQHI
jgi:hypothetical protein